MNMKRRMTTTCHSNINVGRLPITLTDVLNRVSEEDILAYYFNIYKIPILISSPLRKDTNPSFSIYYNNSGKIRCYDFGLNKSYGVFDLLMEYLKLDFYGVIERIWYDMCHLSVTTSKRISRKKIKTSNVKLEVKTRNFQDYDLAFWNSFGINQEWLRFGRIFAISDIILTKNNVVTYIPADKYAYVYVEFKDNIQSLKIYQPFNKRYKWMSDGDSSIWNLWTQLPERGEKLIITSSLKDALCLWANLNIPSCCLQSEIAIPKKKVIDQLKLRFAQIYILYDNDYNKLENTGQIRALELSQKYNLINLCIDDWYQAKDPSDFYQKYGRITFQKYFQNLV